MKKLLLVLTVVAMASFLLVGCLSGDENTAPVITTIALPNATVGIEYTATVAATDADVDALTFSLVTGPTGMVMSEAGVISGWIPAAPGTQPITVAVTDGTDSVSADFTITIEAAPEERVAPVIAAIDNQTISWGEDFEQQVTLTAGTDLTPTYTLAATRVANAIGLEIDTDGLITWTPLDVQKGLYEVTVTATDTVDLSLFDTEVFTILVEDPAPPPEITASFAYGDFSYPGDGFTYVKGYTNPDLDCVDVTVTLSEALEEGEELWIRWQDDSATTNYGPGPLDAPIDGEDGWVKMTLVGGAYEKCLTFEDPKEAWIDCELLCVEVAKVTPSEFCPTCPKTLTILDSDLVRVDSVAPVTDLDIIFDSCTEGMCPPVNSISFTFEPDTTGDYCDPEPCCEEECSGIAFWSIEDITDPCDYCPALTGTGCPDDTYECGCLLCSELTEPVVYELYFTFADNVGNEFVDTWTITVDSGCAVTAFVSEIMEGDVPLVGGVYELYDFCPPVPVLAD